MPMARRVQSSRDESAMAMRLSISLSLNLCRKVRAMLQICEALTRRASSLSWLVMCPRRPAKFNRQGFTPSACWNKGVVRTRRLSFCLSNGIVLQPLGVLSSAVDPRERVHVAPSA